MSTIVRLEAENYKRLKAVRIDSTGQQVVTIGGVNGAGKTSVLDSIASLFGGADEICERPIRVGEDKADLLCETDDGLIVRRKHRTSKSGSETTALEVSQRTAFGEAAVKSPQAILDSMCGRFMFDPLSFSRLKPRDQLEQLKELVGVNTDEIDGVIDQKFRERTDLNRTIKELDGQASASVFHADAPNEEVSVAELMAKVADAQRANRDADELDRQAEAEKERANLSASRVLELEEQLARARQAYDVAVKRAEQIVERAASAARLDPAPLLAAVTASEGLNRKVRENAAATRIATNLEAVKGEAAELSRAIDKLRVDKQLMLEQAAWPVPRLGFGDSGVMLNGLPFDQASAAEKLRVSVAMGFAMNPKLKVLLIRDGSLLDANSMRLISEMSAEAGGQLWVEVVTADADGCSVLIEDGEVCARKPAAELECVGS